MILFVVLNLGTLIKLNEMNIGYIFISIINFSSIRVFVEIVKKVLVKFRRAAAGF